MGLRPDTPRMAAVVRPPIAPSAALERTATWSRVVVGAAVVVGALPLPEPVTVVLVTVGLLAGLPHGSVDHVLASRLTGRSPVLVTVAYALVALIAWLLLHTAGPVALVAVVALSVVHFGRGELEVHRAVTGWRPGRVVTGALVVAGTGALLLPLARSGEQIHGVAAALSPVLAGALTDPSVQVGSATLWVVAAVVVGVAAARAGRPTVVVDVALIGLLGVIAPPLVAFAVWFGGWHSLRHIGRLLTLEPRSAAQLAAGRTGDAIRTLTRLAALPTAAAVATVGVLVAVTASAGAAEPAIAEILRVLLALTVPHMLIVTWLDRRDAERRPLRSP